MGNTAAEIAQTSALMQAIGFGAIAAALIAGIVALVGHLI
jgi:hypothetical protein